MTDTLPPESSDTPPPDSSCSRCARASRSRDLAAFLLAGATLGALTAGWFKGLFAGAPAWMAPVAIVFAGLGASEKARILGSTVGTVARAVLSRGQRRD
jgi:hypothetical protein